ncbi:VOC family protein [Dinoroseobacter sp. S76]|uniref:VOC family protein n=1 Tax=Dinoroseobacter sp. S76 TaxID=3415124 RepID=UPI003C7B2DDD
MPQTPFRPRALGEIAIRCRDFEAMLAFYGEVLGLDRLAAGPRGGHRNGIAFFRLGESFGGHVAVLALFSDEVGGVSMSPDAEAGPLQAGQRSSLHHLALSLPWEEQEAAAEWLRAAGCAVRIEHFDWTGWRGLFTSDPDGNTVELVAASAEWHLK